MAFPLENEIPISSGFSVKAFGQISAMAALMSPNSRPLPFEVAFVFTNGGGDSIAFEVDTSSSVLTDSDGGESRVTGFAVLFPDGNRVIEKGSRLVPFWVPAGRKSVLQMTFIPRGSNVIFVLQSRMRGPVIGMSSVPATVEWRMLPNIEVPTSSLRPWSVSFLSDIAGS